MVDVLAATRKADNAPRTLIGISIAHWVSHFHMLVLPMLFPFLKVQLGVDYIQLGFAVTVFAVVSGLTQAPIGYLVDHIGARTILLIGVVLGGLSLVTLGLYLSYASLIGCAVLLGLANSVYHPADYAILAEHTDEARMGRAFSVHTFAGYLGGAMTPAIIGALVATIGGVGALIVSGAVGVLVALVLIAVRIPDAGAHPRKTDGKSAPKGNIITPALLMLTLFFLLLGLSTNGINNFGVVALMSGYAASASLANMALTAFLTASAVGVLAGGFLADRTRRHGQVAAVCFAVNAGIVLLIATIALPAWLLTVAMTAAGFLSGVIAPSRDMLVRNSAPAGAAGRAFGIVSTGFNISGIINPLLFGWIMDQNAPRWVFGASAVFMVATVLLTFFTERQPQAGARGAENARGKTRRLTASRGFGSSEQRYESGQGCHNECQ